MTRKQELQLIKAYTDENYHNEALMIKAISEERFDLLKELAEIKIKHLEDGFISQDNLLKRREIEKELN